MSGVRIKWETCLKFTTLCYKYVINIRISDVAYPSKIKVTNDYSPLKILTKYVSSASVYVLTGIYLYKKCLALRTLT